MKKLWMAAAALALGLATAAQAAMPLQLGIAGDAAQIFDREREVVGLKLNLPYAVNDYAAGVDLGLFGGAEEFKGLRLNAVNLSSVKSSGLEFGLLNLASGEMHGLQLGAFNRAGDMHGLQFGLVNISDKLYGLQIGLINAVMGGQALVLPFVNVHF